MGSSSCSASVPAPGGAEAVDVVATQEEAAPEQEALEPPSQQSVAPIPVRCASAEGECLPPSAFVDALCEDVYPEVALYLLAAGTPWRRMFLSRSTNAVNASGGATIAGKMPAGEEVLILRHRGGQAGDIQMGGGKGQYDALRWNGSCVSLEAYELKATPGARVRHASIEWKWLGDEMRAALRSDEKVEGSYRARRKECRGARSGNVSKKCQRLTGELSAAIVRQVRGGLPVPNPGHRPSGF